MVTMAINKQAYMRYERVPLQTLVDCLAAWGDLLYAMEYRESNSAGEFASTSEGEKELRLDVALDVSDIWTELVERHVVLTWCSITDQYTAEIWPHQAAWEYYLTDGLS